MPYSILAFCDFLGTLFFALFVNWWAPLFLTNGDLPSWLKWAGTFDSPLAADGRDTYWKQVCWLYRNCSYGFSYWVLGVPFDPTQWKVIRFTGSESTGDLDFYAEGPNGQFNEHYMRNGWHVKRGWKAWNLFDMRTQTFRESTWGPTKRIPIVWSLSRV